MKDGDARPGYTFFNLISRRWVMSRTLIDVDDDALARAAAVLGTSTKVETVNRALQLVADRASRQAERERFDELLDLVGDPQRRRPGEVAPRPVVAALPSHDARG
jgi:Arc/MetJ family transcription regulator